MPVQCVAAPWRLGDRADGGADAHRLAEAGALWSELIPWRVVDNRVRVVDQASGETFPWITAVETQLRREVELRRAAQREAQEAKEQTREAQEQAQQAQEQARLAEERERLARREAQAALERERLAVAEARLARERAERETATRQALEAELARLRRGT